MDICQRWDLIDNDLYSVYGIDSWDSEYMDSTPWPWLKRRIMGLLGVESRITNWAKSKAKG